MTDYLPNAAAVIGPLSRTDKMPCHSWSIPAADCVTGSQMRRVPGSTCSRCYAHRNRYNFARTQASMRQRLKGLRRRQWARAMASLIWDTCESHFRWFDSGDLQNEAHLRRICQVAERLPGVKFWLPTREYGFVLAFLRKGGRIPSNLIVRISAVMIDAAAPPLGLPTSTVHTAAPSNPLRILNSIPITSHVCPAKKQGNKCGPCRACWDATVSNVSYPLH
jgi:hypothetical protein